MYTAILDNKFGNILRENVTDNKYWYRIKLFF